MKYIFYFFFFSFLDLYNSSSFYNCFFKKNLVARFKKFISYGLQVKEFVRFHPFVAAKCCHEGLGILFFIIIPSLNCKKNCKKTFAGHIVSQSKHFYYDMYIHCYDYNFGKEAKPSSEIFFYNIFSEDVFLRTFIHFLFFPTLFIFSSYGFNEKQERALLRDKNYKNLIKNSYEESLLLLKRTINNRATERKSPKKEDDEESFICEYKYNDDKNYFVLDNDALSFYQKFFSDTFKEKINKNNIVLNNYIKCIIDYYCLELNQNFYQIYRDALFLDFDYNND